MIYVNSHVSYNDRNRVFIGDNAVPRDLAFAVQYDRVRSHFDLNVVFLVVALHNGKYLLDICIFMDRRARVFRRP